MATAPVGIAPVFTPQTFRWLADWADESELPQVGLAFKELTPFVEGLVHRYFRPLLLARSESVFRQKFVEYSLKFEPFRFYLIDKLRVSLAGRDVLGIYKKILDESILPLVAKARSSKMSPELIRAVLRDQVLILEMLSESNPLPPSIDSSFEKFDTFWDWVHRATRLDFGLTAIFLILDGSIDPPNVAVRIALMMTCRAAVIDLAASSSEFLGLPRSALSAHKLRSVGFATEELAAELDGESRVVQRGLVPRSSRRDAEIEWLSKNTGTPNEFSGKWVVLDRDELIASDSDYEKARLVATRKGIKRPFIIFVPPAEGGGFMGI